VRDGNRMTDILLREDSLKVAPCRPLFVDAGGEPAL